MIYIALPLKEEPNWFSCWRDLKSLLFVMIGWFSSRVYNLSSPFISYPQPLNNVRQSAAQAAKNERLKWSITEKSGGHGRFRPLFHVLRAIITRAIVVSFAEAPSCIHSAVSGHLWEAKGWADGRPDWAVIWSSRIVTCGAAGRQAELVLSFREVWTCLRLLALWSRTRRTEGCCFTCYDCFALVPLLLTVWRCVHRLTTFLERSRPRSRQISHSALTTVRQIHVISYAASFLW